LTETAVNRALGFQRLSSDTIKLGSILLSWELLDEDALLSALAKLHHSTPVPWSAIRAAKMEVVQMLPAAFAKRVGAIAYAAEKGVVRIAFINPSDIAAVDEAAAISGRRVMAGVTTELRMMQAQHRFYGRHVPLEYRAIIQKIQRKTAGAPRMTGTPPPHDFRADDLVQAERGSRAVPVPPSPFSISVEPGQASERDLSISPQGQESVQIEVPEMPSIEMSAGSRATPAARPLMPERSRAKAPAVAPPTPLSEGEARLDETIPVGSAPPAPLSEGPLPQPAEDSLAEWVGEALMSFQLDPSAGSAARPETARMDADKRATDPNPPKPSAATTQQPEQAAAPTEDPIANMWQPAPPDQDEDVASNMWTTMGDEPGSALHEARSRDEIADTVLANSLTDIPRVILLGIGRTFVTGWRGRGPLLTPERVAGIRVPVSGPSIFATVRESGVPHFGPVHQEEWTAALRAVLGNVAPDCAVFPIRVGDDVAAFLYADRFGEPMQYEDFAKVARAAASAAGVLARFLLRHNAPVG
jgi:hypothetical protein